MKLSFLFFVMLTGLVSLAAQVKWAGSYEGMLDRDLVKLTLVTSGKNIVTGTMTDSANKYDVEGTYVGNTFTGTATEKNLGLTFGMVSILNGNNMPTTLSMDVFGTIEKMEISFTRSTTGKIASQVSAKNPVTDKKRDPRVVGLWVKESNYSSGYGFNDSYGAMNVTEKMAFLADGTMAEGGSQANISGSNYSGSSSSDQNKIIEGLHWYTDNQKIYLVVTQNGQTQTVEMGKYYIENNNMLITGTTGEKLLLSKR
jgi:hypothetical protein